MKHFQLNPTLPLRNEDSTLYLFKLEQGIREESHDSKIEYFCCSLFNLLLKGFVFTVEDFQSSHNVNSCSMFLKNNVNYNSTIVKVLLALCVLIHVFCTLF